MSEDGDCFSVAWRIVFDSDDPTVRLVHAVVTGQGPIDGVRYDHAWVERIEAIDASSLGVGEVGLPVAVDRSSGKDVELPAALYRTVAAADDIHEYTRDEAMVLALSTGHYGPWHEAVP